jgi:hypothetical protein
VSAPTALELELARDVVDTFAFQGIYRPGSSAAVGLRCQYVPEGQVLTPSGAWEASPLAYLSREDVPVVTADDRLDVEGVATYRIDRFLPAGGLWELILRTDATDPDTYAPLWALDAFGNPAPLWALTESNEPAPLWART